MSSAHLNFFSLLYTSICEVNRYIVAAELNRFCSVYLINVISMLTRTLEDKNILVLARKLSGFVGTHIDRPRTQKKDSVLSTFVQKGPIAGRVKPLGCAAFEFIRSEILSLVIPVNNVTVYFAAGENEIACGVS